MRNTLINSQKWGKLSCLGCIPSSIQTHSAYLPCILCKTSYPDKHFPKFWEMILIFLISRGIMWFISLLGNLQWNMRSPASKEKKFYWGHYMKCQQNGTKIAHFDDTSYNPLTWGVSLHLSLEMSYFTIIPQRVTKWNRIS